MKTTPDIFQVEIPLSSGGGDFKSLLCLNIKKIIQLSGGPGMQSYPQKSK